MMCGDAGRRQLVLADERAVAWADSDGQPLIIQCEVGEVVCCWDFEWDGFVLSLETAHGNA